MEGSVGDKYRSHLVGEAERNTRWRHGSPPTYDLVNLLFEQERTKEWPEGSLEETVQNAIKTWEMELSHKTRLQDFKSISPSSFRLSVNGAEPLTGEETLALGSYNALLRSALPEELRCYRADAETFESSHEAFRTAFPRGFAWEVTQVYAGPPTVVCKFRHWGYMEGPFKGRAPTGEMVQFHGVAVLKVDEELRVEEVEIYYDPGEFLAGLIKGPLLSSTGEVGLHATTNPTQNATFIITTTNPTQNATSIITTTNPTQNATYTVTATNPTPTQNATSTDTATNPTQNATSTDTATNPTQNAISIDTVTNPTQNVCLFTRSQ